MFLGTGLKMELTVIGEILQILVSPHAIGSGGLEDAFRFNIKHIRDLIRSLGKFAFIRNLLTDDVLSVKDDVTWQFVELNLRLISLLQTTLNEKDSVAIRHDSDTSISESNPSVPSLPDNTLSVAQMKTVSTSLQFIVWFGICRYLLPGVGVPLSRRTEFGEWLRVTELPCCLSRGDMDLRLLECTDLLLECVSGSSSSPLGQTIAGKYIGDLLAALFQICHVMRKTSAALARKPESDITICRPNEPLFDKGCLWKEEFVPLSCAPACQRDFSGKDVEFYTKKLETLLEKGSQPSVIHHLLILQNGVPPSSKLKPGKLEMEVVLPPAWLKKMTRRCLVRAFTRPDGIQSLFSVLLQGLSENQRVADWKRYEAVANIVVECPLGNTISVEDYYQKISEQIFELLYSSVEFSGCDSLSVVHRKRCVQAAVQMMSAMLQRQPRLTKMFLTDVLLEPMLLCLENHGSVPYSVASSELETVVVEENALTKCLEMLHLILYESNGLGDDLVVVMQSVLDFLLHLYCYVQQSITYLRNKIEGVVHWIFHRLDLPVALNFLDHFCLKTLSGSQLCPFAKMKQDLSFSGGENGGISVILHGKRRALLDSSQSERFAESIVRLIISAKRQEDIGVELFLLCLKNLTDLLTEEFDSVSDESSLLKRCGNTFRGSQLLDSTDVADAMTKAIQRNLTVLSLIAVLCEKIGPSCLSRPSHILEFVDVTLTRGIKILQSTDDAAFGAFETETLTMALGLLTSLIADKEKLSSSDWTKLEDLLLLLQRLSEIDVDTSIQEMALDLRIAIATHGLVQNGRRKSGFGNSNDAKTRPGESPADAAAREDVENLEKSGHSSNIQSLRKGRPLIEVLSGHDEAFSADDGSHLSVEEADRLTSSTSRSGSAGSETASRSLSGYRQAMEELCDSAVPVRGHGLVELHRLIERRDAETLANAETVLEACRLNLCHADSYVYLPAIRATASLGERFPTMVIPRLATEYSLGSKERRTPELQMKLGEILVKLSSSLGETMPYYRDLLLGAVLCAAKDSDALVRASAISNLGEICRLLKFSLGNVVQEIFACIESLLKNDKSVEVRRSAAMFSTLLFRGLSKDTFKVLGSLLIEFYRLLKYVRVTENDDVVQHHVRLSVEELDLIIRDYLTPSQELAKQIRIVGPFESG